MISKRGDRYLRMLLIHRARAVLAAAPQMKQPDRVRTWAIELAARGGHNKATVALANKLARYAWAVATRDHDFALTPAAARRILHRRENNDAHPETASR